MFNKSLVIFAAAVLSVCIFSCNESTDKPAENGGTGQAGGQSGTISPDSLVKRGSYLVMTMGCDDCHTPKKFGPAGPEPDMEKRLAGHINGSPLPPKPADAGRNGWVLFSMDQTVAIGPWGTSYAANISSDSTGIGAWSEKQFSTALRQGRWKGLEGARELMPPMPWRNYQALSDEDVRAIFAFLKSTNPVKNAVPDFQPAQAAGL